ncbi:MAG TPA: oligosaccharide flippase family protein, partial [Chitinophaga sp.]
MSDQKYAYWLKSGFYSALQKFSVLLFGIGSVMVLNRSLPKADMGVWNLFLTGSAFVEVIRHSLIKNAVIKYLNSEDAATHAHINSAALSLNMIVTTLITVLLVAFIVPLSNHLNAPALAQVMFCFIPGLLLLIPFSHFEWVQNANADFKGIFWAYLVRQGVSFTLIVIHLLTGHQMTLTALIIYFDLGLLAGVIISGSFAYKFLQRRYIFEWGWIKKLWNFGGIVFGTNISSTLFRNTDQFIISSYIGPSAVALYGICLRASNMVDLPSQVLADILFPKSAETMEN